MKAFLFKGDKYLRCIPGKQLFKSTMVHEVVNRGDIFALRCKDQLLTIIPGGSEVEHLEEELVSKETASSGAELWKAWAKAEEQEHAARHKAVVEAALLAPRIYEVRQPSQESLFKGERLPISSKLLIPGIHFRMVDQETVSPLCCVANTAEGIHYFLATAGSRKQPLLFLSHFTLAKGVYLVNS